ncbi:putative zinc ribbon protein [Edwardsiella piscicida]
MLKCYLARDSDGKIWTANDAINTPNPIWCCQFCNCPLHLHSRDPDEPTWFEHDQHAVSLDVLKGCAYLDASVNAEARHEKLRDMIAHIEPYTITASWYCVLCHSHYQGCKQCPSCNNGIYSIEEASWQANYANCQRRLK